MPTDLIKTFTYLSIHLTIGFSAISQPHRPLSTAATAIATTRLVPT